MILIYFIPIDLTPKVTGLEDIMMFVQTFSGQRVINKLVSKFYKN